MSRSNPTDHAANPAVRWYEWNGEQGTVRYYDKEAKKNVDVGDDFTFLLLDELGSVGGWHDESQSGIYSNEVRDTRQDVLVVKAFKGGTLAEGLYKDIKDRVCSRSIGGQFVANCYIAFKLNGELAIGSIRFKGAALGAWMEFRKANRSKLYEQAVQINGYTEGKKGRITFRVPKLYLKSLSEDSNRQAIALDSQLQTFLTAYLAKTKREQVDTTAQEPEPVSDDPGDYPDPPDGHYDDDIPFAWLLPLALPFLSLGMLV